MAKSSAPPRPETWGEPDAVTTQVTDRYGTTRAMAWDRIHPG
nr:MULTISPECIES: hypothetical protein [unclassified Streptomyces]